MDINISNEKKDWKPSFFRTTTPILKTKQGGMFKSKLTSSVFCKGSGLNSQSYIVSKMTDTQKTIYAKKIGYLRQSFMKDKPLSAFNSTSFRSFKTRKSKKNEGGTSVNINCKITDS
jgi:hypothetical protein